MTEGHRESGVGNRPYDLLNGVVSKPEAQSPKPVRIGVLASGEGTNLQAIIDGCRRGEIPGEVVIVVSNKPEAQALSRARRADIPAILVDQRQFAGREPFEARLREILKTYSVELVCLAGWMRILSPTFVGQFTGRMMNIHPSLLPLFGGPGMYGERVHEAVLHAGMKVSGCTVHFVDETTDGGPIILQAFVPVEDGDTPASLAERVAQEEHRLYPRAISLYAEGSLFRNRASGVGHREDVKTLIKTLMSEGW